jgi:hypothetical protein
MEDYDNFTFSSSSSSSFPEFSDWRLWQLHFSSCFEMEEYNIFTFLLLLWVLRYGEREKTLCNTVVNQKKKKEKYWRFLFCENLVFFFLFQRQNWAGRVSKTATGSTV